VKDGYFTIHVTPQNSCSFASFETNIILQDYTELAIRVLQCFKPSQFILTLMGNRTSMQKLNRVSGTRYSKPGLDVRKLLNQDFHIEDDILLKFEHYDLIFLQLMKNHPENHPKRNNIFGADETSPQRGNIDPNSEASTQLLGSKSTVPGDNRDDRKEGSKKKGQ